MKKGHSKIIKAEGYRWREVPVKVYKEEGDHFRAITRQTLMGVAPGEERLNFETRYFEVQPGGYSTLERHEHPHAVMILRGEGEVILGDEVSGVGLHDCVYIASHTLHQFHATGDEPLGFLCIVDKERDRPQLPDDDELHSVSAPVKRRLRR